MARAKISLPPRIKNGPSVRAFGPGGHRFAKGGEAASPRARSGLRLPARLAWGIRARLRLALSTLAGILALLTLSALLPLPREALAAPPSSKAPARADKIDRSTPRRAYEGYLRAIRAGNDERAARYLDLRALPPSRRASEGAVLAGQLGLVLGWTTSLDPGALSDQPEGDPDDGPASDVITTVPLHEDEVPIALARTIAEDGAPAWLFSRSTVSMVPPLYAAYGARWIGDRMPEVLTRYRFLDLAAWQWIGIGLALVLAYALGIVIGSIVHGAFVRIARRTPPRWDDELAASARGPLRLAAGALALELLLDPLRLTVTARAILSRGSNILLIVGAAWLVTSFVQAMANSLERGLPPAAPEGGGDLDVELRRRAVRTRIAVLGRMTKILVGLIALSVALMQFDFVRSVGMSLLASAGVAGVVLGFAAQRTLGAVVAGIQLSLTQPLRIGDTVVVEGEFGEVEAVYLTYVVVRIWDQRRLVVPASRFLEQPFQNWTRVSPELLGTVELELDFHAPVDALRAELSRLCEAHPNFDGRVCKIQMTDASNRAVKLRVVVSAADSGRAFDLRCDVREGLVRFLQRLDGGAYLPRMRQEILAGRGAGASAS